MLGRRRDERLQHFFHRGRDGLGCTRRDRVDGADRQIHVKHLRNRVFGVNDTQVIFPEKRRDDRLQVRSRRGRRHARRQRSPRFLTAFSALVLLRDVVFHHRLTDDFNDLVHRLLAKQHSQRVQIRFAMLALGQRAVVNLALGGRKLLAVVRFVTELTARPFATGRDRRLGLGVPRGIGRRRLGRIRGVCVQTPEQFRNLLTKRDIFRLKNRELCRKLLKLGQHTPRRPLRGLPRIFARDNRLSTFQHGFGSGGECLQTRANLPRHSGERSAVASAGEGGDRGLCH